MLEVIGLDKAIGGLKNLQKQMRYATFMATNKTVADVQTDMLTFTASKFHITTGWLRRGGYGVQRRVTPYKEFREGGEVEGKVFFHEGTWWMKEHEKGGMRDPSGRNMGRKGKRLAGFTIPLYKGKGAGRKPIAVPAEKTYRVWQPMRALIFERLGKGVSRLIAVMLPKVKIPATWRAEEHGGKVAKEKYEPHFNTEIQKAILSSLGR